MFLESITELADTGRGVEHRPYFYACILHHLGNGVDDRLGSVESSVHTTLYTLYQFPGLPIILRILADDAVQLLRLVEISQV